MSSESRTCQNCKQPFIIEPDDFTFYSKIQVPPPTWCPECRLIRRMCFENQRTLYKRQCDLCKKAMVSVYPSITPFPVYCPQCWWSDKWDALAYGRDYDFSKPFFLQFKELSLSVPKIGLYIDYPRMVNSDYANLTGPIKNCHLVFLAEDDENCHYSSSVFHSKDAMDCVMVSGINEGYHLLNCRRSYKTFFSVDCENCLEVYFSRDCVGCQRCFCCANLRNQSYCIFNKHYSKEEYLTKTKEFRIDSWKSVQNIWKEAEAFWLKHPRKFLHGVKNVNASGDYLTNSKNAKGCFAGSGIEDSKYCWGVGMPTTANCYDYGDWGNGASWAYESINCGDQINNVKFSWGSWVGHDWEYAEVSFAGSNHFGCVNVRKKDYCILNKQYAKEEYLRLVPKIREHMNEMPYVDSAGRVYKYGEFFPPELSLFAYNETTAQEYFPITKEMAIKSGFRWRESEENKYVATIETENLPDVIGDVDDSILKELIRCAHRGACNHRCTSAFRIIPEELALYRRMGLSLPRLCYNCRYRSIIQHRNPLKLWRRKCQCAGSASSNNIYKNTASHFHGESSCPNEFETSYSPDGKDIIYCEKCYQAEVV